MKRLSVGFQGTVDHRHRVKIQRRKGMRNFRARDNFALTENERNVFRLTHLFDNPDLNNMYDSRIRG